MWYSQVETFPTSSAPLQRLFGPSCLIAGLRDRGPYQGQRSPPPYAPAEYTTEGPCPSPLPTQAPPPADPPSPASRIVPSFHPPRFGQNSTLADDRKPTGNIGDDLNRLRRRFHR